MHNAHRTPPRGALRQAVDSEHCAVSIDVRSQGLPLGRAHLIASTALREARRAGLPVESIVSVGGLRRYAPDAGAVSLLAVAQVDRIADVLTGFAALSIATRTLTRTEATISVATERGPVTLHTATPDQRGAALVWETGSRTHLEQLAARADRFGLRFEDGTLSRRGRGAIDAPSEPVLYRHLGLPFIPPELREGTGEVDAAERGEIPLLVTDSHIRGDLHMHSTWSDGRDTLEAMVYAAHQLGYDYVAITDHSERSLASRTLSRDHVQSQRQDIEALRGRLPGIVILHGVEVDIMKDGSLDFPDDVLEGFDIVLASLHDRGGQQGDELTSRYLKAIAHPLVNVITHPANRTPAVSPGYDLDFDALFAAAAETGTAMEVDGAPGHLDMDGAVARRAATAGVTIVIDSDCHRFDALGRQMRFGVGTARRGWIEPHHVLNTRSIDDVRAFVAAKRARV
jgi:DNA polymerase (family X)